MNVKGEHIFNIAPSELWAYLMDPKVLEQITPGDTHLDNLGGDEYQATSNIKIGPVKGTFEGALAVEDKIEPQSFNINMKQKSKIGNAQGLIAMQLEEVDPGTTKLSFDGKVGTKRLAGYAHRTGFLGRVI